MSIVAKIQSSFFSSEKIINEGELSYRIVLAEQHHSDDDDALYEEVKNLFSIYIKHLKCFTRAFVDRYAKYLKHIYNCKTYFDLLNDKAEKEILDYSKKVLPIGYIIKGSYQKEQHIIYVDNRILNDSNDELCDEAEKHLAVFKTRFLDSVVVPNSYFSFRNGWRDAESPYILEDDWVDLKNKLPDVAEEFINRGKIAYDNACKKVENKRKKVMNNLERTLKDIPKKEQERIEIIEFGAIRII